jgi:threonine/homoserine/homoserine lactone efflux protein
VLLLAFLGVSALLIVMPGQDTALTIRNTLAGGRRAGVRTVFGVSVGQSIWALAAAAGLAALGNPKMPVFFSITLGRLAYAPAVARADDFDFLCRSPIRRSIDAATGAVLVAFGLRLAAESR